MVNEGWQAVRQNPWILSREALGVAALLLLMKGMYRRKRSGLHRDHGIASGVNTVYSWLTASPMNVVINGVFSVIHGRQYSHFRSLEDQSLLEGYLTAEQLTQLRPEEISNYARLVDDTLEAYRKHRRQTSTLIKAGKFRGPNIWTDRIDELSEYKRNVIDPLLNNCS